MGLGLGLGGEWGGGGVWGGMGVEMKMVGVAWMCPQGQQGAGAARPVHGGRWQAGRSFTPAMEA